MPKFVPLPWSKRKQVSWPRPPEPWGLLRTDGKLKVMGKLAYGADHPQGGFLHGKILRSPHPHALIKSVQIEKATKLPGVVAVLTAKDVPGRNGFGVAIPDQPVICGDKVRFVGDAVALVAAETEEIAQRALSLIAVEYELLPAIFDPREALNPGAPAIHEKGNLLNHHHFLGRLKLYLLNLPPGQEY